MDYQLLAAALIGIALLLVLILKFKIQAFLSLLIASISIGLVGGMPPMDILTSMREGMGSTLAFVATIVGLGALFGAVLEHSGGAQSIAASLLKRFGIEQAPLALMITGFVVSIPVFFDVAFIILVPVVYALQKKSGKSLLVFGLPLLVGLAVTHVFVPPTPGPVAVADILGANLGWVILVGLLVGIPTAAVAGLWYSKRIGQQVFLEAPEFDVSDHEAPKDLPSPALIGSLIALPIVLILLSTIAGSFNAFLSPGVVTTISFIGHPFTALIIANLLAWYILGIKRGYSKDELADISLKSLGPAGMIILLTGAGGVLKQVLVDTGVGTMLAGSMASAISLPVIFGFVVALIVRVMQGSATVAMITAAGMTAPVMAQMELSQLQLAVIVIAIASGATSLSHVNDSGFWLINRYFGMTEKQTLRVWTTTTGLIGLTGFVITLLLSLLV